MASGAADSAAAILSALDALRGQRVLVAGDAMLDRYWFGRAERISPEAPVPVLGVQRRDARLGGAGNVAANITALGGRATLVTVVGDDDAGRELEVLARAAGVDCELITARAGQTTVKLRAIAGHQQLLRADFEARPGADALDAVDAAFAAQLSRHRAAALSDYGKGGLARIEGLIGAAAGQGVAALVDPKGVDFGRYRGAALVTPNLAEFEAVAGAVDGDDDLQTKAEKLLKDNQLQRILVTLGERGMALFSGRGEVLRRAARARAVFDVSGAGDSVLAVLALAAAAGVDDGPALALANLVAGIVVSKVGTATATADEVRAELRREGGGARDTGGRA